ncbi:PRA1 family protein 2-like [Mizuhopecten yessoensis]|uniref:PRA1 family protein 2-like n=1 Tax=Mizuhopecten yessoensis TaxID=6573 RepID=UPI000B459E84|nr:PRA1 family protein 2-like [Mizuhopecten yessoensis]
MGSLPTPGESERISVSLPPSGNSRDFLINPVRFAVFNPFDPNGRSKLKTNINENLTFFQTNYYLTILYTYCLAILTFIVAEFVGGVIACILTTSLILTIVYLSGTGRLEISLNCGLQHFLTPACVAAVLTGVLLTCVTHMYAFFLLSLGIVISMFPVLLHASLRVANTKNNVTVKVEYSDLTTVLSELSKGISKKVLVMWTVTGIAALYCMYNSYTWFMLSLAFILILVDHLYVSSML